MIQPHPIIINSLTHLPEILDVKVSRPASALFYLRDQFFNFSLLLNIFLLQRAYFRLEFVF